MVVVRKMPKSKKRKAQDDASVEETFSVEYILDSRIGKGNRTEYLLKWMGYPDSESTWEPENNLDCPELIEAYERERSQGETSSGASASNSVKPAKSVNSVDISKSKVKVGGVVE